MVMACTMIFENAKWGWSETHYHATNSHNTAMNALIPVAEKRLLLLASNCKMQGLRTSNPAVRFDSAVWPIDLWGQAGPPGFATIQNYPALFSEIIGQPGHNSAGGPGGAHATQNPWDGYRFRGEDVDHLHRKSILLRGLPDVYATLNAIQRDVDGTIRERLNNFAVELVNREFGMLVQDRSIAPLRVASLNAPGLNPTFIFNVDHGWNTGDTIHVFSGRGEVLPRGYFRMVKGLDNTLGIGPLSKPLTSMQEGPLVRKISYVFARYFTVLFNGLAERDTGRPSNGPRGRQSVRYKRYSRQVD